MKTIDIDQLSEAELVDLNHRIVERLRFLQQARAHTRMLEFSIGDTVCFQAGEHGLVEGLLTRYNKKTVTVIADGGRQWNVSPGLLRRVTSFDSGSAQNVMSYFSNGSRKSRLAIRMRRASRYCLGLISISS
jgi:hypothetical protein